MAKNDFRPRIALALAGTAVALLALELGLRAFWPQENVYLYTYQDGYIFNRPDYHDLFAMTPWASLERLRKKLPAFIAGDRVKPLPYFKAVMDTNARGQRDDRVHAYEKGPGFRILNLGDSISFGWPVPLEQTYLRRLEALVPGLETVNCSIIAGDTAQLRALYEKECGKYKADLVIVQLTVHKDLEDADYIGRDPYGPHYRLIKVLWRELGRETFSHVRWDADGIPFLDPSVFTSPELLSRIRHYFEPRLPLYRQSQLMRLIENSSLAAPMLLGGGSFFKDVLLRKNDLTKINAPSDEAALQERAIQPTWRYLSELHAAIEQSGAKMLVLIVPTSYRARELDRRRDDLERLRAKLRAARFEVVDIEEWLRRSPTQRARIEELFYRDDFHPTAEGYQMIANALRSSITGSYGRSGGHP